MVKIKNIFLEGENIYLRNLELNDLSNNYLSWLNDQKASLQNSHALFPYTINQIKAYIESTFQNRNLIVLAIVVKEKNIHIGNISLQNINWINRNAEYAILLGNKNYWRKGIAFEASELIIRHGFNNLNLHRIYCGTTSENIGMNKLANKLNMKKEGIRCDAFYKNGKYIDIIEYGLLANFLQE